MKFKFFVITLKSLKYLMIQKGLKKYLDIITLHKNIFRSSCKHIVKNSSRHCIQFLKNLFCQKRIEYGAVAHNQFYEEQLNIFSEVFDILHESTSRKH